MRPGMRWKYNLRVGGGGGLGCGAFQSGAPCSIFQIFLAVRCGLNHQIAPAGRVGGGGGDLKEVWVGMCRRGHQTFTLFKTNIAHFATPLLDRKPYFMKLFI